MSIASYKKNKQRLKDDHEMKQLELKAVKHFDRYDIENEREKRWIYGICLFFAGIVFAYFLMK